MRKAILLAALLSAAPCASAPAGTDWTTFGGNMQREGFNAHESVLTKAAVPQLTEHWEQNLNGPLLTQPTVARGIATAQGKLDLVFAANMYGGVFALNADTGAKIWKTKLADVQTDCPDFQSSQGFFGVAGTPTLDLPNNRMLVVDGVGMLHALDLGSGQDDAGFPIQILDSTNQGVSFVYGSPTLSGSTLYVATSGVCDSPPSQGEVIAVDLNAPRVTGHWFVTGQGGPSGGGIWGFGGVSLEPDGSSLYAATGNAYSSPANYPNAERVVQLSPDLQVLAADAPSLGGSDTDFGATPLVFDPPGCPPMLAAMNKIGKLFVYDRTQIGNGPIQTLQIVQDGSGNGNFIGIPAYDPATEAIYFGSPINNPPYHHGLVALSVGSDCRLSLRWNRRIGLNTVDPQNPMIPPMIAHGVVWYADGDASRLAAFGANGGRPLWNSGSTIAGGIFTSPTVANGQVFVAAFNHLLYAFGL